MAAEYIEPPVAGQQANDVLGETVAEVFGVGLLTEVGERQHGDGRLARCNSWLRRRWHLVGWLTRWILRPIARLHRVGRFPGPFAHRSDEAKAAPVHRLD